MMNWTTNGYGQHCQLGPYVGDSKWSPPSYDHQICSSGSNNSPNSVEETVLPLVEAAFRADELVASLNHLVDSDRSSTSPLSDYGYTYGLSDLSLNPAAIRMTPSPPHIISNYSIASPVAQQMKLQTGPRCPKHIQSSKFLYCKTCSEAFCIGCDSCRHINHVTDNLLDMVEYASQQANQTMNDARLAMGLLKADFDKNQMALESSQAKAREVSEHVRDSFRQVIRSLESREKELLEQIENHRIDKTKVLKERDESLKNCINKLKKSVDQLSDASRSHTLVTNPENLLKWKDLSAAEIFNVRQLRSKLPVIEDNWLAFEAPSQSAQQIISQVGNLIFRAPRFVAPAAPDAVGRSNQMFYGNYPHRLNGCPNNSERSPIRPIMPVPRGRAIPGDGPAVLYADAARKTFAENVKTIKYIGTSGQHPEEALCRPWGVACDREGNLVVADRSNNRIVIYRQDGSVVRSFGSHGKGPGQLDRPAGVAVDARRRIIVADKDNHRVQVFTMEGDYLFGFGNKGLATGQFNYPWDVAVNSECQIAVTDSRNHRVQLFSPEGIFLRKFGFDGTSNAQLKNFDSPRGITFNPEGQLLVNDFNNHRIVLIDADMCNARILVGDTHGIHKTLQRPQGLTVDDQGNIYVADSKNHRIAMFDKAGVFKWKFGTFDNEGNRPDGMDRPSGIALTPDRKIAVIDFGNNRLTLI